MKRRRFLGLALGGLLVASAGWPVAAASDEPTAEPELTAAATLTGDEAHLLAWVNLMRSHASRPALAVQPSVQQLAHERSADMAERSYFSHTTPEGETVLTMLPGRSVNYSYAGEALQRNNYPAPETVQEAIRSLMDSPPHREILLDPRFTHVGIGHAVANDLHYFTVITVELP